MLTPHPEIGKFGQWPSIADFDLADVAKYRPVLKDKYPELVRAIGLISHGVGVGSFVYLCRIFESLIEAAHATARAADASFSEEEFQAGRMDQKILLLESYLPSFLVENRALYGILSKGIHDLTEEDCLRHFETVRTAIELILDERLAEEIRASKLKQAAAAISKVRGELRG